MEEYFSESGVDSKGLKCRRAAEWDKIRKRNLSWWVFSVLVVAGWGTWVVWMCFSGRFG